MWNTKRLHYNIFKYYCIHLIKCVLIKNYIDIMKIHLGNKQSPEWLWVNLIEHSLSKCPLFTHKPRGEISKLLCNDSRILMAFFKHFCQKTTQSCHLWTGLNFFRCFFAKITCELDIGRENRSLDSWSNLASF